MYYEKSYAAKFVMRTFRGMQKLLSILKRSVLLNKESITAVYLHVFGDANIVTRCTVVYK